MDNKMDLVVSFDTTGSMYPCLSQVRMNVENFINEMFTEFRDLRIGIIAHGDYCDHDNPYTIKYRELSRDAVGLCKFVRNVERTYGGDADECYELVLNLARSSAIGWREDADKIFLMIGDASPHSPSYPSNKDNLDWRDEAYELGRLGVKVFSVHALASLRSPSRNFYKKVASDTCGVYLTLEQFNEIIDLIKATVYQQSGEEKLDEFITIIKDTGKLTRTMNNNFRRLKGEDVPDEEERYSSYRREHRSTRATDGEVTLKEMGGLVPVEPSRFQVMTVDENCDIKGFVNKNGIEFKKGRGFYELTKAETVQQYKEVIMQDRETGEMFNGSQVREKLGLQPQSEKGGVNERLHAADAKAFRVFVQSTSVNRKLIKGTTFLYEIPDMEYDGTTIDDKPLPDVPESVAKEMRERAEKEKAEKAKKESTPKKKSSKTKKKEEVKPAEKVEEPTEPIKEEVEAPVEAKVDEAEKVDETPEVEKEYIDSVEFSETEGMVDIMSASNKEIDEMLKGKENKLTERLTGTAAFVTAMSGAEEPVEEDAETVEEEPVKAEEPTAEEDTTTKGEPKGAEVKDTISKQVMDEYNNLRECIREAVHVEIDKYFDSLGENLTAANMGERLANMRTFKKIVYITSEGCK